MENLPSVAFAITNSRGGGGFARVKRDADRLETNATQSTVNGVIRSWNNNQPIDSTVGRAYDPLAIQPVGFQKLSLSSHNHTMKKTVKTCRAT